ncbi:MAG: hypothetical protein FJ390_02675 [Verrucomicrobia bacterium]|nr:hypothetical protein [Verrucomicrobiota bacterium]
MLKNSLHLFCFLFLFLTTLRAIPSGEVNSFNLSEALKTPSKDSPAITARNRRRSSLCPVDSRRRSSLIPGEREPLSDSNARGAARNDSFDDHDSSGHEDFSEASNSFQAQMDSYAEKIQSASNEFWSLARQIKNPPSLAHTPFIEDQSPSEEEDDSFFSPAIANPASTALGIFSPFRNDNLDLDDSNEETASPQFHTLTNAKNNVVANTYWYTTELLEKIISSETENPSNAAAYWEDLVQKTKDLITLLEKYQMISSKHCSSDQEMLGEIESEIRFYQARLAEYEAEDWATGVVVAHENYLSFAERSSSSDESRLDQNKTYQGSQLLVQSANVPVEFHHAAETYRKISKESSADNADIAALHEMMALWCEARAAEVNITATGHISLVHGINLHHDQPIITAQQAYDAVITACTELLPKFSNDEELTTEHLEVTRYLNEATTRKQLLEAQLQKIKVNSLLSQELTPTSSEYEKFLLHENQLGQLQSLNPLIVQQGLEQAPDRLKNLWTQVSYHDIPDLIEKTNESLKENISHLIQEAAAQAASATNLQQREVAARTTSLTQFLLSLDHASSTPTTTHPIDLSNEIIKAAKTTFEKYETAFKASVKFPDFVPEQYSTESLQIEKNYWHAASIKFQTDHYKTQAIHWIELSKQSSGEAKIALLEKAAQEIEKANHFCDQLVESISQIYSNASLRMKLVPITREESLGYRNYFAAKQQEISETLAESKKPSWYSWFCSFFKMPRWVYFWRTVSPV